MLELTRKDVKKLVWELADKIDTKGITSIYGIPRGGYAIAIELGKRLGLKVITDETDIDSATLIVDDLVDSGKTISRYKDNKKAVLFVKNKKKKVVDYFVKEATDWVRFPDEPQEEVQEHIERIIQYVGEDTSREGLLETPKRVQKAYDEIFSGYKQNPKDLMKTFKNGSCKEMVILKNCEFYSTCEHHMFPFFGHISIGYIPNKKVIGISKLARLVDLYSKRMQIQERMTTEIAETIMKELNALGVYVVCEGVHFCMRSRGVKKQDASMITSAVRGIFKKDAKARQEFLTLIKR